MENTILLSNCWEKVEKGYISTFATLDRTTHELISVSYHWHEAMFSDKKYLLFDNFEDLQKHINTH